MVDLKEYPLADEMRRLLIAAAEQDEDIARVNQVVARIKAMVEFNVCDAVNDAGKPKYGNETLRTAAVTLELGEREDYRELQDMNRASTRIRAIALAEAEAIKNAIRLACATARVGVD